MFVQAPGEVAFPAASSSVAKASAVAQSRVGRGQMFKRFKAWLFRRSHSCLSMQILRHEGSCPQKCLHG